MPGQYPFPLNLHLVPVSQMFIDPSYQRGVSDPKSRTLLKQITSDWNWARFGIIILSERGNNRYAIIDGQLRWVAAKQIGIAHLPSTIYSGLSPQDEAILYDAFGTKRRNLTPVDAFRARIIAKDQDTLLINKILEQRGLKVGRLSESSYDGTTINAVSQLYSVYRKFKANHLAYTLDQIQYLWRGDKGSWYGKFIVGMAYFLDEYGDERYSDDAQDRLASVTPPYRITANAETVHAGDLRAGEAVASELRKISKIRKSPKSRF